VKLWSTGTMVLRPGCEIGLPTGPVPVGVVYAEARGARQARPAVKRPNMEGDIFDGDLGG
jgi:hypothetical protein